MFEKNLLWVEGKVFLEAVFKGLTIEKMFV